MKKIFLSVLSIFILLIPSISFAKVDQHKIQKELVISRNDVTVFYWEKIHKKIDAYFINLLQKKDKKTLNSLNEKTAKYLKWKQKDGLNKEEILVYYLFIRSHYEANFRLK